MSSRTHQQTGKLSQRRKETALEAQVLIISLQEMKLRGQGWQPGLSPGLCPTGDRGWEIITAVGHKRQHAPTTEHLEFWIRDKACECTCPELAGKHELTGPLFILCILGRCGAVVLQISEIFCWVFSGKKYFCWQGKEFSVRTL